MLRRTPHFPHLLAAMGLFAACELNAPAGPENPDGRVAPAPEPEQSTKVVDDAGERTREREQDGSPTTQEPAPADTATEAGDAKTAPEPEPDWAELLSRSPSFHEVKPGAADDFDRDTLDIGPYQCTTRDHLWARGGRTSQATPTPGPQKVLIQSTDVVRLLLRRNDNSQTLIRFAAYRLPEGSTSDLVKDYKESSADGYGCSCDVPTFLVNAHTEAVSFQWRNYWIRMHISGLMSLRTFEYHVIQTLGLLAETDPKGLASQVIYSDDCLTRFIDSAPLLDWYGAHKNDKRPKTHAATSLFPTPEGAP